MSERDTLNRMLWDNYTQAEKDAALDALVAETLADAAQKLRQHAKTMGNQEWATGTYIGADMIDPNSGA